MKIAVLGASLSAQALTHDGAAVTGYCEVLRRGYQEGLGITEIRQFVHPGNRLSDAGIIGLQNLCRWSPDLCIVEPLVEDFSRGRDATLDEIIYVYRSLIENDVLPVTLFVPNPVGGRANAWPAHNLFEKTCRNFEIPTIKPEFPKDRDIKELFSGVHTTPIGALWLAEAVATGLRLNLSRQDILPALKGKAWPEVRIFTSICDEDFSLNISELEIEIQSEQVLPRQITLLQPQLIGPHSPVIDIFLLDREESAKIGWPSQRTSVWDPHCHYTRKSFVTLFSGDVPEKKLVRIQIMVSRTVPEYSKCRREDIVWPSTKELQMRPLGPLYCISASRVDIRLLSMA